MLGMSAAAALVQSVDHLTAERLQWCLVQIRVSHRAPFVIVRQ